MGFKCPECAAQLEGTTTARSSGDGLLARFGGGRGSSRPRPSGRDAGDSGPHGSTDGRLPPTLGARATLVGVLAALVGGAVLSPVLQGGAFFLLTSGLIGWAVARSVYWATDDRNSPYVRALALTLAGFAVAVALGIAGSWAGGRGGEIVFLAYPAAVYGGWIVVRQR